jgi:hypothetical protein
MATARDFIKRALRKIAVLGTGSSLSAEDADDALDVLNSMLSSFSVEGATVYEETQESFSLVGNQASYTIGSGQDFNTTAPWEIRAAYVRQGSTDYPVLPYDEKEYSMIAQKSVSGSVPKVYYYDNNFPIANIYFYPVPSSADTFTWFARKPLTTFATLDTVFSMPAQYEAMIVNNLAVWLAPEYEKEASPSIKEIAKKSKKTVKVENKRNEKNVSILSGIPMRGAPSRYTDQNIYSGYYT